MASWKTLNGTNLSGETIDPGDGFKLKIQDRMHHGSGDEPVSYVRILTNSTLTAQAEQPVPAGYQHAHADWARDWL